jgi:hypothetical protein
VRRTGDAVCVFVAAAQLETVREVLRRDSVAFEVSAAAGQVAVLTLIGGDADAGTGPGRLGPGKVIRAPSAGSSRIIATIGAS